MKKVLFCLSIMTLLFCSSCKKDEKTNYADAFVGNYDVWVEANFNVPIMGSVPYDFSNEGTIEKNGDEGDVTITMMDQTVNGYVRADGLHIEPIVMTENIAGYDMNVTVTVPVIAPPVDGVITASANMMASVAIGVVNGTADITAIKKQ